MSATINDLKFTIFGAGHDYTLNNSGTGEGVRVFSHPYVPLNSVHYAGMWLFYVADENGDLMDAVKDDLAHCTFTPALGATFDTEGETDISVHYHREYIHDESTIIVDKTFRTTIEVVDHGTRTTTGNTSPSAHPERDVLRDIYSDGYCFWRPYNASTVRVSYYHSAQNEPYPYVERNINKTSSIPWRAKGLGYDIYPFAWWRNITDISELAYADISSCEILSGLFSRLNYRTYAPLADLSPLAEWDVSNVKKMQGIITGLRVDDLTALSKWDVSNVEDFTGCFSGTCVKSFHGIEDWNVSKGKNFSKLLSGYDMVLSGYTSGLLPSLEPFANWDVSNAEKMDMLFGPSRVNSLHGIENWNVSKVKSMKQFLYRIDTSPQIITSLSALSNWNPHIEGEGLKNFLGYSTGSVESLQNLNGLENFDVSQCTSMYQAFYNCNALNDISAIEGWDFSNVSNMNQMLHTSGATKDASSAQNWNVSGTGKNAFNSNWTNIPSWN